MVCGTFKFLVIAFVILFVKLKTIVLQFPRVAGLTSPQYAVAIRLIPDQGLPNESLPHQQSARTSGSSSNHLSSEIEMVNWNEIFFFKVDSPVSGFSLE